MKWPAAVEWKLSEQDVLNGTQYIVVFVFPSFANLLHWICDKNTRILFNVALLLMKPGRKKTLRLAHSLFPLHLQLFALKADSEWEVAHKNNICTDYASWGSQMNNSLPPPLFVCFLLQCDSESDIDDKVRLLFLCLFTNQKKVAGGCEEQNLSSQLKKERSHSVLL